MFFYSHHFCYIYLNLVITNKENEELLHYKSKQILHVQIFVRKGFLRLVTYDGSEKTITTQHLKGKTIYNQQDMWNKQRHIETIWSIIFHIDYLTMYIYDMHIQSRDVYGL